MRLILFYTTLLTVLQGCNKSSETQDDKIVSTELMAPPPKEEAVEAAYDVAELTDSDAAVVSSPDQTTVTPKIIKTGTLRFETADLNESFLQIQKALVKHKASIQNDDSGKDYASSYRNVTVRVPNASFDAFIADISQGVKHFDRKEISAEDVTEEYVDVEARLKAKKILEKRYFELLSKANKVSEMLEIERELSKIREEIEAKEGRLKYLQHQVAMSTIHLEMYTNNPSESGATVSYFGKMGNAMKDGFNNIATFFLGILNIWPFILIFVILIVFLRRRFKKKTA
ncbi:DUF4349 domain-containing protein [Flavobacterium enshiense]|uniref:DUF4349 domain-containing protein n=1 Tax=Flavobacterium enshiense TaxID=1341165 RepID=UPI00345D8229